MTNNCPCFVWCNGLVFMKRHGTCGLLPFCSDLYESFTKDQQWTDSREVEVTGVHCRTPTGEVLFKDLSFCVPRGKNTLYVVTPLTHSSSPTHPFPLVVRVAALLFPSPGHLIRLLSSSSWVPVLVFVPTASWDLLAAASRRCSA